MDISLFVPTQPAFRENVRPWAGPGAQRSRHDFLGMAHSVNGRSIDPVYTKLKRAMNRGDRLRVILFAQPNSQPDPPMAQAPKPIGVMNKSELPSRFVFISTFFASVFIFWITILILVGQLLASAG